MSDFTEIIPIPGKHGGARPGGGRPKGYSPKKAREQLEAGGDASGSAPTDGYVDYSKARARSESAKADMAELDFKIKSGQYVDRAAVRQASATAFATCAQAIRSIPDNLERKAGVTPDVAQRVSDEIDRAMAALSTTLEMMSGADD